ncbi:peptide deformylase [Candidatus Woesebacteria bacterium]|nr:MAG: peptide deformylase [Candidatus Woesebacteria bacterium]
MIRKIVGVKDPSLRRISLPVKKVDKKIKDLIRDMEETLVSQKDPEGIGLAAPQIGKNLQIFLMKLTTKDAKELNEQSLIKVVINPQIVKVDKVTKQELTKKREILEGCLSLPHYYGPLVRSSKVTINYLDENGEKRIQTFSNLPAQIVLHEIDHLNGILFVDRLLEQGQPLYEYKADRWKEVELT